MKMKFLLCLLLSACSLIADDLPEQPFVIVKGSGSVSHQPDIAVIYLSISNSSAGKTECLASIQENSSIILSTLKAFDVDKDDIDATDIRVNKKYSAVDPFSSSQPKEEKEVRFTTSRSFEINYRNLDEYSTLLKEIYLHEFVDVVDVSFDTSEKTKIEQEALSKAIKDSRQTAKFLAESYDTEIKGVFAISQQGFTRITELMVPSRHYDEQGITRSRIRLTGFRDSSSSSEEEPPFFVPSKIETTSNITVIYLIKDGSEPDGSGQ
ncbi:SIMPL domain-containing protein [Thalassobacterium maritimum]|nr:SIMPL domain-containing protein [Coraliomargarita sp. SDUM461003]